MLQEALDVWNALKGKITQLFHELNSKGLQCERYDVTTAPNGSTIGVTKPFSDTELLIPYSWECSSAKVGDSVLVAWWGNSLSTARAWFKGSGGEKSGKVEATLSLNGYLGYRAISREAILGNSSLNSYWKPGHYFCRENATAETLNDSPTNIAFIMDVYSGNGDKEMADTPSSYMYITQRIETYRAEIYLRRGYTDAGTTIIWDDWSQIAGVNCVIEQGAGSGWRYRKWSDGTLEEWMTDTVTDTIDNAWGVLYDGTGHYYSYFPSFVEKPTVQASLNAVDNSAAMLEFAGAGSANRTPTFYFVRPLPSSSSVSFELYVYAIGRWK